MGDNTPEYEIRLMTKEEIPQVLDLWRERNPTAGTHSLETWFEYDPEAFYIAVTKNGTVLGACAGVLQNNDLGFIGMYYVKSTYQRRGIGKKIWNRVMMRIGDRNAGVNTVQTMLENYRDKAGFPIQSDWCSVVCKTKKILASHMTAAIPGISVSTLSIDDTQMVRAVAMYEKQVLGFARDRLIPLLCTEEDSVTVVASSEEDGSVYGYGCIRHNIKGDAHLGPLFADDAVIAETIMYHLVKSFPVAETEGVTVMIVDCNEDAIDLVERLGFEREPGNPRLYRSEEVDVQFKKVFSQHNLNFSVF